MGFSEDKVYLVDLLRDRGEVKKCRTGETRNRDQGENIIGHFFP